VLGGAAFIYKFAPNVPGLIRVPANSAVYVEAKTDWSFDAVTNFIVVMVILALLVAQRALAALTKLLLTLIVMLPWLAGDGEAPVLSHEAPRTRWVWTAMLAWLASIAAVHTFD
jgi:hypothetical protein